MAALGEVQKRVAGQAEDWAKTSTGAAEAFNVKVGEMQEKIGSFVDAASQQFIGFLSGVVDVLDGPDGATAGLRDLSKQIYAVHQAAAAGGGESPVARMNRELQAWADTLKLQEFNGTPEAFVWLQRLGPDTLRNFGAASADSMADVRALAQAFIDTGRPFTEFAATIRQKVAPSFNVLTSAWTGAMEGIEETTQGTSTVVDAMVISLPKKFTLAVVDMKERIKEGKAGIIEQFRDLAWQSKHPFAEKNYAKWLAEKYETATRRMENAARKGRPAIVAQYRKLREAIQVEMALLPRNLARIQERVRDILGRIQAIVRTAIGAAFSPGGNGHQIGARASGGPVRAGQSYLVGEKGPELVTMGSNGYVTPNHALAGGATYNINVHIAPGGDMVEAGRQMVNAIRAYERRSGAVWRSR
jgi:hypothetical protein